MDLYPYTFRPLYKEKIWGGRNLERLFGRPLPAGAKIGESWELTDLKEGASVLANGPDAGATLTELTGALGEKLLGRARPLTGIAPLPGARGKPRGAARFPLLLKLLDANDILSLQVHPDQAAASAIGGDAASKVECWYILESRNGFIYLGLRPGVRPEAFRKAIEANTVERLIQRIDVKAGEFYYLPAGTVHALGPGVVVAEVQTPSDTTYRISDWGRGREIHVERSLECIRFEPPPPQAPPGADGTLLVTDFFTVSRRGAGGSTGRALPQGKCTAIMLVAAQGPVEVTHDGPVEKAVVLHAGDTLLLPAGLSNATLKAAGQCQWLQITLPER